MWQFLLNAAAMLSNFDRLPGRANELDVLVGSVEDWHQGVDFLLSAPGLDGTMDWFRSRPFGVAETVAVNPETAPSEADFFFQRLWFGLPT